MGGSIQKKGNRYRVCVWWQGRNEWFSTYKGEPLYDPRAAKKLLAKIQTDIDSQIFNPFAYRPNSPLGLKVYSDVWLQTSTACPNTKKGYRWGINKAIEYFGEDQDIREFTHSKLLLFMQSLTLSQDGKYSVMGSLKTMLNFYRKDMPTFTLPVFPPMSKGEPVAIKYLTFDEQQIVLQAIPAKHRAIFIVMMDYGIRPQEATALKWDCIMDDKIIFKRSHSEYRLRETTKTGAIREERITSRVREALHGLPKHSVWTFTKNERGSHYDSKALNRIWRKACEATGIDIGLYEAVRHSLGCQLADAGYSLDFIQDVYLHTSIKTTRRYAKRQRGMISEAIEQRGKVLTFDKSVRKGAE